MKIETIRIQNFKVLQDIEIQRASEDEQIKKYMDDGDLMGYLWKEGFFKGADPQ